MCALKQDGDTALYRAMYNGHTETVDYLLSVGADLNITNNVSLNYHTAECINTNTNLFFIIIQPNSVSDLLSRGMYYRPSKISMN